MEPIRRKDEAQQVACTVLCVWIKATRRNIQIIYQQKQEEYGNLCVPLNMKGTRIGSAIAWVLYHRLLKGFIRWSSAAALGRRAASAPCPACPHCSSLGWLSSACLPWAPDATKSRQRCAGRDFCCSCPSLPCYTPGKRAITPPCENCLDSLWTPCLHFRIWLQTSRAIWPCKGYKSKTTQQPASDKGAGFGTRSWKACLPWLLVPTLKKEEITLEMGLCWREIYTFLFSFVYLIILSLIPN